MADLNSKMSICIGLIIQPTNYLNIYCNYHSLEVVSRWRDPQLQVSENYSDLTKWMLTIFKYCWLMPFFTFIKCGINVLMEQMKNLIKSGPAVKGIKMSNRGVTARIYILGDGNFKGRVSNLDAWRLMWPAGIVCRRGDPESVQCWPSVTDGGPALCRWRASDCCVKRKWKRRECIGVWVPPLGHQWTLPYWSKISLNVFCHSANY